MRKFATYGAAALLVLSTAVGVSYAQDATATVTPATTTQTTAAQAPVQKTWLGVAVTDDGTGVTIARVSPNSPAETAQLQVGDVILSVNGTTVETAADLQKIIEAEASGDVASLVIERNNAQTTVSVTLATRSAPGVRALPTDPLQAATFVLHAELKAVDGGYQVVTVMGRNPFNLAVGDVITEVNGTAIASMDWSTLFTPPSAATTTTTANTVTLTVTRDGASTTLEGQLGMFGGPGGRRGGFPGNGQGGPGNGQPGGNNGQPNGNPPGNGNAPQGGPGNGNAPQGNNGQPNGGPGNGNAPQGNGGVSI